MKKLILVTGATGAQGGSVARHLLARGTFAVRALTRNPESEAARKLAELGAEVVKGDLGDRASLREALRGVYGVFGVTNFWEHFDQEIEQGRNLINAVAGAEVEHFVFSSLPSVAEPSGGELKVPHFEQKHELSVYARSLGIPTTFVHVAFYYENFTNFFPPQKGEDGAYHFGFPQGEVPLAGVSVEDVGGVVNEIFEHPAEYVGTQIGVVGDELVPHDYAAALSRVSGARVAFDFIPREVFSQFPFPGAADLADMFEFNTRYLLTRKPELEQSRALYPAMRTFDQWTSTNRDALSRLLT